MGVSWRVPNIYRCIVKNPDAVRPDKTELEEARWISRRELKDIPLFDDCRATADRWLDSFEN